MPLQTKFLWSLAVTTAFTAGIGTNKLFPLAFNAPLTVKCQTGEVLRFDRGKEQLIFVAFKDVVMNIKADAYEIGDRIYGKATISPDEAVNWVYDTKGMKLRRIFMNTKGQLTEADEAKCEHYSGREEAGESPPQLSLSHCVNQ